MKRRARFYAIVRTKPTIDSGGETPDAILTEAGDELSAENDDVLIQE